MFPVLRDGKNCKVDDKDEKVRISHAEAFRRDLRRAFGVNVLEEHVTKRRNGRRLTRDRWVQGRDLTPREVELFEGTAHILPVDFHSWRRAYCQSLADAGVNAQLAQALAGHSTEAAHHRYLLELREGARATRSGTAADRPREGTKTVKTSFGY